MIKDPEPTAEIYRHKLTSCGVTYTFGYLKSFFKGAKVLDLGCATGEYLSLFECGSVGIDYSEPNLMACAGKGLSILQGDLNHALPFDNGAFDVVFSSHTIEHLDSPLHFLREARRVVKVGGFVIIGVPLEKTLIRIIREGYFSGHSGHIYGISPESMMSIFKYAKLEPYRLFFNLPFIQHYRRIDSFLQNRQWPVLQYIATMFWLVGRRKSL